MAHLIQLYTTKSTPEEGGIIVSPIRDLSQRDILWDHFRTNEFLSLELGQAYETSAPSWFKWHLVAPRIEYVLCPSHLYQGHSELIHNKSDQYVQTQVERLWTPGGAEYLWSILVPDECDLTVALVQNHPETPHQHLQVMPLYQPEGSVFGACYQWYNAIP